MKRAVPGISVLAGSTVGSNLKFIAGMYKAGAKGKFDGLSIHPYNGDRHPLARVPAADIRWSFVQGVPAIRDLMVAKGDARKRLWLTEVGFSTCTASDQQCVTPQEQADFTAKTLLMADAWSYVAAVDIYNMRNLGTDGADREQNFGLLAADFTPKPVYLALQALAKRLTAERRCVGSRSIERATRTLQSRRRCSVTRASTSNTLRWRDDRRGGKK